MDGYGELMSTIEGVVGIKCHKVYVNVVQLLEIIFQVSLVDLIVRMLDRMRGVFIVPPDIESSFKNSAWDFLDYFKRVHFLCLQYRVNVGA